MYSKLLIFALLLFTPLVYGQEYSFTTIDKNKDAHEWEIRLIPGTIKISDSTIVIKTDFNTHVLKIQSSQQFIKQNDKIFRCLNEDDKTVNLRLRCDYSADKQFSELYYYSNEPNNKYFRFCLKRI